MDKSTISYWTEYFFDKKKYYFFVPVIVIVGLLFAFIFSRTAKTATVPVGECGVIQQGSALHLNAEMLHTAMIIVISSIVGVAVSAMFFIIAAVVIGLSLKAVKAIKERKEEKPKDDNKKFFPVSFSGIPKRKRLTSGAYWISRSIMAFTSENTVAFGTVVLLAVSSSVPVAYVALEAFKCYPTEAAMRTVGQAFISAGILLFIPSLFLMLKVFKLHERLAESITADVRRATNDEHGSFDGYSPMICATTRHVNSPTYSSFKAFEEMKFKYLSIERRTFIGYSSTIDYVIRVDHEKLNRDLYGSPNTMYTNILEIAKIEFCIRKRYTQAKCDIVHMRADINPFTDVGECPRTAKICNIKDLDYFMSLNDVTACLDHAVLEFINSFNHVATTKDTSNEA